MEAVEVDDLDMVWQHLRDTGGVSRFQPFVSGEPLDVDFHGGFFFLGGGNSKIFYVHPDYLGKMNPF